MATRRRRGEDGISFEHRGPCRDPERHPHCPGLWRGEITLGYTGDGKRTRRKVSGKTKAAVVDKLRDLHLQPDKGITPKAGYTHYTVRQAAEDWLASGLDGPSPKTVKKNQNVLDPILAVIGARKLRELSAADVRQALATMAAGYSTAAVTMGHLALKRAIRHAEASDLVTRNVAALADTPQRRARPQASGGLGIQTTRSFGLFEEQGRFDALDLWGADALVDREGLSQVCGALARVSFLDMASSDSLERPCFLDRCVDVAGDAERLGEIAAGFAVCRRQEQEFAQVDRCPGLALPVAQLAE